MNSRNPFLPPTARVADVAASPKASWVAVLLFGACTLAQLGLAWRALPFLDGFTRVGTLLPIGLPAWKSGLACLYAGALWLVGARRPARALFAASVVLQLLAVVAWRSFLTGRFDLGAAIMYPLPVTIGIVLAAWGAMGAGRPRAAAFAAATAP